MADLFLHLHGRTAVINRAVAAKYGLTAGTLSPFTRAPVVRADGSTPPKNDAATNLTGSKGELINDGISELENGITLSQSEILDFSAGTDSSNQ